ncbi:hypothetical protein [Mesorhizobium sp. WSM3860]|nr:hypothetical protein [Mesorhizobium sp. WSM3860]
MPKKLFIAALSRQLPLRECCGFSSTPLQARVTALKPMMPCC